MRFKMIISTLCAVTVIGVMSMSAFAAIDNNNSSLAGETANSTKSQKFQRPELTDAQKAEMEANRAEMKAKMDANNEKWTNLTDAQKEELYLLKEQIINSEIEIIDKYLQLGLIDEKTATDMKAKQTENKNALRESGKMPFFGNRGSMHRDGQLEKDFNGMSPKTTVDNATN